MTTSPSSPSSAAPLDGERADLLAELATARSALTATVRGLSDEQAAGNPTVSALCLGGLIKHVASIEEGWLRFALEGPSALLERAGLALSDFDFVEIHEAFASQVLATLA
ncbi:DUF664 domain-containing protein, partial [Streptomyces sp. NPDC005444]|uniref:mycothiol transferase n=1 Tax=Streptomyces sp. NPDC005444 TaxID=3156881 RepID=UPI0033A8C892